MGPRLAALCLLLSTFFAAVPAEAAGNPGVAAVRELAVPYRSQLDGNPWELSDCGPASMAMVLGAFGKNVPTMEVRGLVNDLEGTWYDTDAGTFIENFALLAQHYGLRAIGIFKPGSPPHNPAKADGKTLRRWTLDEVRQQIDQGHPVIPQVWYRGLPGRERKPYGGDHFIVITGYAGDDFIYNDPIDKDGVGYERRISASRLDIAWRNSDFPYAAIAFAGPPGRPAATTLPRPTPTAVPVLAAAAARSANVE